MPGHNQLHTYMVCPRCGGDIQAEFQCRACDWKAEWRGGILDTVDENSIHYLGKKVTGFYGKSPFPGYADQEDATSLLDKALQNPFARALDDMIPANAKVLDCGTGTGQIPSILALRGPQRTIVGLDLTLEQLQEAERFRAKATIPHLNLVRGDIFDLPFKSGGFDIVISRGVVHHTQAPEEAIGHVARLVKPGGILILGYYDGIARMPHRLRRVLFKLVGRPIAALDPILKRRDLDEQKKRNWIADQYEHPVEHQMGLFQVKQCLNRSGLHWVRSIPPYPHSGNLLETTADPGRLRALMIQLGWMITGVVDQDAGLVCVVVRRQGES